MITVKNNLIKTAIFLSGFLLIGLVYYLYKIQFINQAQKTEGVVTKNYIHGINKSDFGSTFSAEIRFIARDSIYTFLGPEGQLMKKGELVPVAYLANNPEEAVINTFDGYWLNGLIWCLLPAIFWLAISLSFIQVKQT